MLCGKLSNLRFDGLHQQRTRAAPQDLSEESTKAPGWASLMTLLSDTAYHSFIGEVEALNTTTIRRLTPSRRHQLLAIAPGLICFGFLVDCLRVEDVAKLRFERCTLPRVCRVGATI